jgi:hypothetical protein
MRISPRLAAVVSVVMAATACTGSGEGVRLPPQPSAAQPGPPAPAATPTVHEIAVSEVINDDVCGVGWAGPACTTLNGSPVVCHYFALTAPADGVLTATLTWDPMASDNLLLLRMEKNDYPSVAAPWSPISGDLKVVAGSRYSIDVGLQAAGSECDSGKGPYVLTTALK